MPASSSRGPRRSNAREPWNECPRCQLESGPLWKKICVSVLRSMSLLSMFGAEDVATAAFLEIPFCVVMTMQANTVFGSFQAEIERCIKFEKDGDEQISVQ